MEAKKKFDTLFWGAILIWAGIVFGADSLGILARFSGYQSWTWVLLGAGVLALGLNLYRLASADQPNPDTGDWIFTGLFLIGGLSGLGFNFDLAWPIILIVLGVGILGNVMLNRE